MRNPDDNQVKKVLRKESLLITMGFIFILNGIFFFLLNIGAFGLVLKNHWPIAVIITGAAFLISDFFIYGKIRASFLFPSLLFVFLGIIFLLFSSNILHITFRRFISVSWPIILCISGVFLVILYGFQKNGKNDFPYIKDDTAEDSF